MPTNGDETLINAHAINAHATNAHANNETLDPLAIYVSNINWETPSARLREIFSNTFGAVSHVNLKENKVSLSLSLSLTLSRSL